MSKSTLVASPSPPDNQMFAEAFEQLDTGFCLIDDAGAVRSCNAAFRDLLGLPANWTNGKRSKGKMASAAEDLIAGWRAWLTANGDFAETVALSPRNSVAVVGKTLPSGGICLSVRPAGGPDVSLLRDSLQQSEARLRAIVDHAPMLVLLKNIEGRVEFVGKGFSDAYGVAPEEAIGKTTHDLMPKAFADIAAAQDRRVIVTGRPIREHMEATFADGSQHRLLVTKFPIRNGAGEMVGIGAINVDVSEQLATPVELVDRDTLLHSIIDNAESLFSLKDLDGRFQIVNKKFEEWYGITDEDAVGKTVRDLFTAEQANVLEVQDRRVCDSGKEFREEITRTFANGSEHTILASKYPVRNAAGEIVGIGAVGTDITDRVNARRALVESEARFRSLLDHLPILISLKDAAGKFVLVNPAWERSFGQSAANMMGQTIWDAVPGVDWSDSDTSDARLLAGECEVIADEVAIVTADGHRRMLHRIKFPVFDASQRPVGIGTVSNDVTALMEGREELRRSEAALRYGEKLARMGNWDRNLVTGDVYWSDQVFEIFGIEKQPVPSVEQVLDFVHPDDRHILHDKREKMFAGAPTYDLEFRIVTPDGEIRHVYERSETEFDSEGRPTRCLGVLQDITAVRLADNALRASEQRFRLLIDNLPNAISLTDAEHRFVLVNKSFERKFEKKESEIIGQPVQSALAEHIDWHATTKADRAILDGSQEHYSEVISLRFGDGTERTFEVRKFPVSDSAGQIIGVGTISTDVTESLRANEALRQSEASLANAQRIAHLGNWDWDITHNTLHWSDEIYNIFGLAKAEFGASYDAFLNSVHPDDRAFVTTSVEAALNDGEAYSIDHRIVLPDGQIRIVHEQGEVSFDGEGRPVKMIGTVLDVTEQCEADRALRESEERFRALVDNLPASLSLKDADHGILFVNKQMTQWYGIPASDFIGKRFDDVFPDRQVDRFSAVQQTVLETGKPLERELQTKFADGERHDLHSIIFPVLSGDGQTIHVGTLSFDVTDRKAADRARRESEERFRAFVDNLPAGVTLKGPDGNVIFINERIEQWYGVPLADIVGKKFKDVTERSAENILGHERMLEGQKMVLETGGAAEIEVPLKFLDGTTHQLRTVLFPIETPDDQGINIGAIYFDITDIKKTEEMLRQAQKMQAVGQLTGGVAHDFNNLLAVVIGNLELIADHFVAHTQQDAPVFGHVRKAFAAAERGASLTHHLLAFARQQVLQPEVTDLADLVAETSELMAVSMGERIAVTLHTDSELWRCRIDRVQLQNAILNLTINARDAMAGSGEITIAVANMRVDDARAVALELSAGDYVCVSISDTGPGIPTDVLEHVYEPFFTTKDVGQGSGLGLSMVYGFVRQSGGAISIDSEVGVGTTVHMYFPAVMPSPFAAPEGPADGPEDVVAPDATILLVEDNPMFREVTRAILEGLNFQVHDFGTAEEALELIGSSAKFDLLLSDIGLPGDMDGHALAQHAASARPGLKIVLMSAHTDHGLNGGIVDHNVAAFLRKPHRKAELTQVLRRLLVLESH